MSAGRGTRDDRAKANMAAGLEALKAESGGLLRFRVLRVEDVPATLLASLSGDREADMLIRAMRQMLSQIRTAPRHRPILCGCCPRPLKTEPSGFSLLVALPEIEDPRLGVTFGICGKCAEGHEAIIAKGNEAIRLIWPDARRVTLPTQHPAGHA